MDDLINLQKLRGGQTEVTTLRDKPIRGTTTTCFTGEGRIEFSNWNNARIRGVVSEKTFALGVFVRSDGANTLTSKRLDSGNLVYVEPGAEREAVYAKPMEGIFVHVQADEFEELLIKRGVKGNFRKLPSATHLELPKELRDFVLTSTTRQRDGFLRQIAAGGVSERAIAYAYQHFLDNVFDWTFFSAGFRYEARDEEPDPHKLVNNVEKLMHEFPGEMITINQVCDHYQVSRHTLRKAFMDVLGVSPSVYLRNWRLSRARAGIRQGQFKNVSEAATYWGFFDLGRFAGYYYQLFDERPSTTLKNAQIGLIGQPVQPLRIF